MRYLYVLLFALVPLSAFGVEGFGEQNLNTPARFYTNTHDSFGNAADADSLPTFAVYEEATGTPVTTGTMALLNEAGTDGFYTGTFTPTEALGFQVGGTYCLRIEAEVDNAIGVDATTFKVMESLETRTDEALEFRFDIIDEQLDALTNTGSTSSPSVAFTAGSSGGSTTVGNVSSLDGTFHELLGADEGNPCLSVVYTFTVPSGSTAQSFFLYYKVTPEGIGQPSVEVYNFTTSTWVTLNASLNKTTVSLFASSLSPEYTGSNQVRIRFTAPDTFQAQSLFVDKATINYTTPLTDFIENEFSEVPSLVWGADLDDYENEANVAEDLIPLVRSFRGVSEQGAENIETFFNNGDEISTQTLSSLTLGSSESGISPRYETEGRVWRFTSVGQLTGKPTIIEQTSYDGLLVMDLTQVLNPEASILSAELVSVTNSDDIEVATPIQLSPNKKKVHLVVDTETANTYEFVVKITTTDSQSFNRKGVLVIK